MEEVDQFPKRRDTPGSIIPVGCEQTFHISGEISDHGIDLGDADVHGHVQAMGQENSVVRAVRRAQEDVVERRRMRDLAPIRMLAF